MKTSRRATKLDLGDDPMDIDRLPRRCLIDTGVFIRALRDRRDDEAPGCIAFFEAMIRNGRTMLVAAPTLAEALRGNGRILGQPLTPRIEHVPFDKRAAELFGRELNVSVLRAEASATGLPHTYMKYDAMIVATAKRHEAECIVALDGDHVTLAKHVGLAACRPSDFMLPVYQALEEQRLAKKRRARRRQ